MKKAPIKTPDYILLEDEFKAQCLKDRNTAEFQISESEYISVPFLSDNPDFVLIALEPGFRKVKLLIDIDFLGSLKNFLIHYCAYYYLSNEGFNYHITDISKSAMKSSIANKKDMRNKVYPNWYPLLQKEINILSKTSNTKSPIIIPLGPTVRDFLSKGNIEFNTNNVVLHYGKRNDYRFRNYYNEYFNNITINFDEIFEKLREFAEKIANFLSFSQEQKDDLFNGGKNHKGVFDITQYSTEQKEQIVFRYLYYKKMFKNISQNNI